MSDGIRWVGLDVHARESTLAILDQATGEVTTKRFVGRPHELLPWLREKAARTRSWLLLLPVMAHARDRALADRASVSALIDRCFHRRSGVVDPAAPARIAARAGSDSRLQPVKHEPLESRATLSLAFRTSGVRRARSASDGFRSPCQQQSVGRRTATSRLVQLVPLSSIVGTSASTPPPIAGASRRRAPG